MAVAAGGATPARGAPRFTVLTPTYNRAHTLPAVYDGLVAQTTHDFEWVVVDDGSTDETPRLAAEWARAAPFSVRYIRQENAGKHRAMNRGVAAARGELLAPLDSDDVCLPHALQRFGELWDELPPAHQARLSGVTVHCEDADGRLLGRPFPADRLDATPMALLASGGLVGDKWGFHRTDVLRAFPFPEIPGERFVPESLVWNRIARCYQMRYVNEVLQRKLYQADGLMSDIAGIRVRSPRGTALTYRELLDDPLSWGYRARTLVNYVRFMRHAGASAASTLRGSGRPVAAALALPFGLAAAARDRAAVGAPPAPSSARPAA